MLSAILSELSTPHRALLTLWLPCILGIAGCMTAEGPSCAAGMRPMTNELLYFGTASPAGPVTTEQWSRFLEDVVSPRLPQGFTVWQATGQWQAESGAIEREDSFVLNVVHAGASATTQALDAIAEAYKMRFQQEAVLRVDSAVCANI